MRDDTDKNNRANNAHDVNTKTKKNGIDKENKEDSIDVNTDGDNVTIDDDDDEDMVWTNPSSFTCNYAIPPQDFPKHISHLETPNLINMERWYNAIDNSSTGTL